MRTIVVVITARASYCRIQTVLTALQEHCLIRLKLIVLGNALLEKYGNCIPQLVADGFKVHSRIHCQLDTEHPTAAAKTTALATLELATIFHFIQPDAVVTIADRYETLATAIASSYQNIPLVHIQGGEISGNIDEKVRHAVTKLADIHFVATEQARTNVLHLGEASTKIWVTGCPSIDLASKTSREGPLTFSPFQWGGVGNTFEFKERQYAVVLLHPSTDSPALALEQVHTLLFTIQKLHIPTFWFWPNADNGTDLLAKGIRIFRERHPNNLIHFFRHLPASNFLELVAKSACLIGNSSTGIRESAFLGTPVVNIGSRQKGRERGQNVIDVPYHSETIEQAISKQIDHGTYKSNPLYGAGNAGVQMAELLAKAPLTSQKQLYFSK